MAYPLRTDLNEASCPVTEQLLVELSKASPPDAVEVAKDLPELQRARLAVFCYQRRHLHALGLMIASTCGRATLLDAGGKAGDVIFSQSRDPEQTLAAETRIPGQQFPQSITLAPAGLS